MNDQENNGIGVADAFALVLEDRFFDGLDRNPVVSNGVGMMEEKAECENLGISSCTVEQEMRNGAEQISVESTPVLKADGEACESLGVSDCNIEEGIGGISLAGGLQSSELEMRNGAEPIAVESTSIVEVDGEMREKLGVSGCKNSNIEEGAGSLSLVSGLGSSVKSEKNDWESEIKMDENESESSEFESDNPSSPTSASSSSSGGSDDSSTSGGSSEDDDSEASEGEGHQEEGKMTKTIEVEVEEGEIKDSDEQELGTDTAASDDEDAGEVSWSGVNDEDDEDGAALEGPIRSKNEVKVILYSSESIQLFEPTWRGLLSVCR